MSGWSDSGHGFDRGYLIAHVLAESTGPRASRGHRVQPLAWKRIVTPWWPPSKSLGAAQYQLTADVVSLVAAMMFFSTSEKTVLLALRVRETLEPKVRSMEASTR